MPQYFYDHIHLVCPDPAKTAEFYEKAFGAKRVGVSKTANGRTLIELNLTGTRLLVMNIVAGDVRNPDSPKKRYGLEHFGVRTDNLEAAVKNLKSMGAQIVQDITASRPGLKIAFVMVPDNVLIELMEISK